MLTHCRLYTVFRVNIALSRQLSLMRRLTFVHWCRITIYHVSMLYDSSIGIACPNDACILINADSRCAQSMC